MRCGVRGERRLVQPNGAEQVRLEPLVDRRVEAHRRRAMDDDVDVAGERWELAREVAVDDVDALVEQRLDPFAADLVPKGVEGGPSEHGFHALAAARTELRPHQERYPGLP